MYIFYKNELQWILRVTFLIVLKGPLVNIVFCFLKETHIHAGGSLHSTNMHRSSTKRASETKGGDGKLFMKISNQVGLKKSTS